MIQDPRISIVIPSAAAPPVFNEVLAAIRNQTHPPRDVILVDDAMDQVARDIAGRCNPRLPIRVVPNAGRGVSAARNTGAAAAAGDVILFIDTDVVLKPDALTIIYTVMKEDPDCDGIVGVQSADLRFTDFFSRWKNHWMRYTYQRLSGDVHLFYTSCAAIRKPVFAASGGFDEAYRIPSVEDTAFGANLGRIGARIRPVPSFQVEHVKRYGFTSVLRTDYKRSAALVKYTLRNVTGGLGTGAEKTSVPFSFISGVVLMAVAVLFFLAGMTVSGKWLGLSAAILPVLWLVNVSWLRYLLKEEGRIFFLKALVFLPVDVLAVDIGIMGGLAGYLFGSRY